MTILNKKLHEDAISRPSLGNIASLGDLYDIRNDSFCRLSVVKKAIPSSAIQTVPAYHSDFKFVYSDSFTEKAKSLEVEMDVQASILGGLSSMQGSSKYLENQSKAVTYVQASMTNNVKTVYESFNIFLDELKDIYATDEFRSQIGTHIVVGIRYGARSVLSFKNETVSTKEASDLRIRLEGFLNTLVTKLASQGEIVITNEEAAFANKFELTFFGDVIPPKQLPINLQSAMNLLKSIPDLIGENKGIPLTYDLLPIRVLLQYLHFEDYVIPLKALDEATLSLLVKSFQDCKKARQVFKKFYEDCRTYCSVVSPDDMKKIADIVSQIQTYEATLQLKLSNKLVQFRSAKCDISEVNNFIADLQSGPFSPNEIAKQMTVWKELSKKIKFAKVFIEQGAKYLGYGDDPNHELLDYRNTTRLLLLFNQNSINKSFSLWVKNQEEFLNFLSNRRGDNSYKFYLVDCDVFPELMTDPNKTEIKVVEKGKLTPQNYTSDPVWMNLSEFVTNSGVIGGAEQEGSRSSQVLVVRGRYETCVLPGKMVNSNIGTAYTSYSGQELKTNMIEILLDDGNYSWVGVSYRNIPSNAVVGGYEPSGETCFIGRFEYDGKLMCGKVIPSQEGCYIPYNSAEHFSHYYDILCRGQV